VIALVASVLLAFYLIIPASIFRLVFGLYVPLKNFVLTRGEEIFQGALSTICPFVLAFALVWLVPVFDAHPFGFPDSVGLRRADYKLLASAFYSEEVFRSNQGAFWKALTRSGRRQGKLLVWYYAFIMGEGCFLGWLAILYPRFSGIRWYNRTYRWFAEHVLLPNISEWHLLLTPFFFVDKTTIVRADILCSDGTLYRGIVFTHSITKDSQLSGVVLTDAKRFRREDYLNDKEKRVVKSDDYWRPIPGKQFYILASKILNLNLSYEGLQPSPKAMEDVISRLLRRDIGVEFKKSPQT